MSSTTNNGHDSQGSSFSPYFVPGARPISGKKDHAPTEDSDSDDGPVQGLLFGRKRPPQPKDSDLDSDSDTPGKP